MQDAVIVSAVRTPIGSFRGALAEWPATELGAFAIRAAVQRAGLEPDAVDEVIMGMVLSAGVGQAPARQAARAAGLPDRIGAVTVNKMCGSGLKAVMFAAQAVRLGDAEVVVAGGMESMTRVPHLVLGARDGLRLGHADLYDSLLYDGLWDRDNDFHMGATAELVAQKYAISRAAQDEFALNSHRKAVAAATDGCFDAEIVPVEVSRRRGSPAVFARDEGPRADASLEALARLRPAFERKGGTVTAGNASSINDGAAAVVVMSAERAVRLGCEVLARIRGYATGGTEPKWVMMAPVDAVGNLNAKIGARADEYDLVELNEAFSAQALAVTRECGFDPARVNVNGGAVALGHPVGASGARVLATLVHALRARGARQGLATLCLGGGNAVAMAVER